LLRIDNFVDGLTHFFANFGVMGVQLDDGSCRDLR
jgi:hypothetical protein